MTITAKLGNMRKAVDWTVYPAVPGAAVDSIVIQSDHRIARIYPGTGKGLLSQHRATGAYFIDLAGARLATVIDVPADVIAAARAAQPQSGDAIGPGVVVA